MSAMQHPATTGGYVDGSGAFHVVPYPPRIQTQTQMYQDIAPAPTSAAAQSYQQPAQQLYYSSAPPQALLDGQPMSPDIENSTVEGISEFFGELKIDDVGIAPFMRKQQKHIPEPEAPILDEAEERLPPLSTAAGSQIRIPPALMPSDEDAANYFDVFFREIHPYVPVINRSHFYHQWNHDRESLSPLLLESLFACAGRLSGVSNENEHWLALARRHEDSFSDTPRLSTLQALCLLLKARESVPKRGYYYRSWMMTKKLVSMAKDLDLHEHYDLHRAGEGCDSNIVECLTKTRLWQTIFICEMMVGGPQGRSDMGVNPETVEQGFDPPGSDMDEFEAQTSRHYACFVRNVRNIRAAVSVYHALKRNKDWVTDRRFVEKNKAFSDWPNELPPDFRIILPSDGSRPIFPSHFVANIHSYYHLGIVMMQRPQLLSCKPFDADGVWKQRMRLAHNSAKALCRLQEAVLHQYGIDGVLCMQRGASFTIYAALTCTMFHLVAITCPDPEFNLDAREYFTRHMRLLEECIKVWAMPEMQNQVHSLRAAFSADLNKPFELKPSFPYGSPSEPNQSSPPLEYQMRMNQDQQRQVGPYTPHTITPPISAGPRDSQNESPHMHHPVGMMPPSQAHVTTNLTPVNAVSTAEWNPSRIFDQWDTAFNIPQSALGPPSTMSQSPTSNPMNPATQSFAGQQPQYVNQYQSSNAMPPPPPSSHSVTNAGYNSGGPVFVTPRDWQQSVASVYDPAGLKRRYDSTANEILGAQMQKRMR
ncbi:MAG: hypothetical protein Q9227_005390 [Pyrenula ochraceoflavens]